MGDAGKVYKLVPAVMELNESFIDAYESCYYLFEEDEDENNKDEMPVVVGVSKTRRWIEVEIENLLEKENWTPADVIHLLAWKMGRINHKESKEQGEYKYIGTWSDKENEQLKATNRSGPIEKIKLFVENVIQFKKDYKENYGNIRGNKEEMLKQLQALKVNGIGSVYLITVLYFVSGGEYPIFDRFAMTALNAAQKGSKPGEKVAAKQLPDKVTGLLSEGSASVYQQFITKLEWLCETIYGDKNCYKGKQGRKIDRALWVYGHLFS